VASDSAVSGVGPAPEGPAVSSNSPKLVARSPPRVNFSLLTADLHSKPEDSQLRVGTLTPELPAVRLPSATTPLNAWEGMAGSPGSFNPASIGSHKEGNAGDAEAASPRELEYVPASSRAARVRPSSAAPQRRPARTSFATAVRPASASGACAADEAPWAILAPQPRRPASAMAARRAWPPAPRTPVPKVAAAAAQRTRSRRCVLSVVGLPGPLPAALSPLTPPARELAVPEKRRASREAREAPRAAAERVKGAEAGGWGGVGEEVAGEAAAAPSPSESGGARSPAGAKGRGRLRREASGGGGGRRVSLTAGELGGWDRSRRNSAVLFAGGDTTAAPLGGAAPTGRGALRGLELRAAEQVGHNAAPPPPTVAPTRVPTVYHTTPRRLRSGDPPRGPAPRSRGKSGWACAAGVPAPWRRIRV